MSASRFAVLSIDDDEDNKPTEKKPANSTTNPGSKKQENKKAAKKQKAEQERAQLIKLAFGFPKNAKPKTVSPLERASQESDASNWGEGENKELPDSSYDQELAKALKLSRLEYEENKQAFEQQKKDAAAETTKSKKKTKKKGTGVVTMEQFNRPQVNSHTPNDVNDNSGLPSLRNDSVTQPVIAADEGPRVAQLQDELHQRDEAIAQLRVENEKLRDEILHVKTRNKKLYGILGQGEMREKAELLIEVEKLTKIKDELTAEVENLAAQLQQEKSKVSMLAEAKKTVGNKK